jgi:hypothetical protein
LGDDSKILRLKGQIDGMLCAGKKLTFGGESLEAGCLGKTEVKGQIFVLIGDS